MIAESLTLVSLGLMAASFVAALVLGNSWIVPGLAWAAAVLMVASYVIEKSEDGRDA